MIEEVVPGPSRQRDELIGIEDALASMPEQQRRAILLREWQGLSYREISDELELSQSAVETLIFRARRSLAQGLEQPDLLKKPRRNCFRRGLHVIDLGTLAAAAKTLLAGSAAVKATAAAVAVTAAVTAAGVTPKVEGHSPKSTQTPASSAAPDRPAGARTPSGAAAFRTGLAPRPVVATRTSATEHAQVVQRQSRLRPAGQDSSQSPPVAVAPVAPTGAAGSTPSAEPAATPATAEPVAQPTLAEQPATTSAPVAQPSHAEPAPVEPAIIEQGTPKQLSPSAPPPAPGAEIPVAPIITVTPSNMKEPVVAGIVIAPGRADLRRPAGHGLSVGQQVGVARLD